MIKNVLVSDYQIKLLPALFKKGKMEGSLEELK